MKPLYVGFLVFLLSFFPNINYSQTKVTVLLFAATEDVHIGKGNLVSVDLLTRELEHLGAQIGSVDIYPYFGQKCSVAEFQKAVKSLQARDISKEVILFYFMGHGFKDETYPSPNLLFYNTKGQGRIDESLAWQNSLNLSVIHKQLQSLGAKLTISLGEACNTLIEQSSDSKLQRKLGSIDGGYYTLPPDSLKPRRIQELFAIPNGHIMAYSSIRGQYSYVSDIEGGIFTQAFILALRKVFVAQHPINWEDLSTYTKKYSLDIGRSAQIDERQIPKMNIKVVSNLPLPEDPELSKINFWRKVLNLFKGSNEPKQELMRVARGKSTMKATFDKMLQPSVAEKYIKHQPFSYYFTLGKMGEEEHRPLQDVFLYYSIAKRLYDEKPPKLSERDIIIVNKLNRLSKNGKEEMLREIRKAGNVYRWLSGKQQAYKLKLQGAHNSMFGEIQDLYDLISVIDNQIHDELDNIINKSLEIQALEARRDSNLRAIDSLNINRTANISINIPNISNITPAELRQAKEYISCIRSNGDPALCRADEVTKMLANKVEIKFDLDSLAVTGKLEPSMVNYDIGEHCDDRIAEITEEVADILLSELGRVPMDTTFLNKIVIKGTITGFADYRGAGTNLGIEYKPTTTIKVDYQDKNGKPNTAHFKIDEAFNITNEQLALLRAYCAFERFKQKVEAYAGSWLDVENSKQFDIDFIAYEQSSTERKNDQDFRGVDIKIRIENLYAYVQYQIDRLIARNNEIAAKIHQNTLSIEQSEARIDQLEGERKSLKAKVDGKQIEADKVLAAIEENDLYGGNTSSKVEDVNPVKD